MAPDTIRNSVTNLQQRNKSLTASNFKTFICKINRRNRKTINECHKIEEKVNKLTKVTIAHTCLVTFANIVTKCDDLLGNIFIKYTKYTLNQSSIHAWASTWNMVVK